MLSVGGQVSIPLQPRVKHSIQHYPAHSMCHAPSILRILTHLSLQPYDVGFITTPSLLMRKLWNKEGKKIAHVRKSENWEANLC